MGRGRIALALGATAAAGVGIALYSSTTTEQSRDYPLQVDLLPEPITNAITALPLHTASRVARAFASLPIPEPLREPLFRRYCSAYHCDLAEILVTKSLREDFPTVASFFARRWRAGARPVDACAAVVAPCDGRVVACGAVGPLGAIDQVKGHTYSVRELLGATDRHDAIATSAVDVTAARKHHRPNTTTTQAAQTRLYYCTIYLSPGDFHRFVCPVDRWAVARRRHVRGRRLPLHPWIARRVPDVWVGNERVAWLGRWEHGTFAMVAVGAMGVGSIEMALEGGRRSDEVGVGAGGGAGEAGVTDEVESYRVGRRAGGEGWGGVVVRRGAEVGAFYMGSSVVVVFEGPQEGEAGFVVRPGERIKVGAPLFARG